MGAFAAYLVPSLLGLAIYMALAAKPARVEAAAVSWGVGWAVVNLVTFSANQFGGARLDGVFYAVSTAGMGVVALSLGVVARDKFPVLLRGPLIPADLRQRSGLVPVILIGAFLALVFYKGLTAIPTSTDALVYHMQLPKLAFQTGTLEARPGVGWLDLVTAWPNLLVTQQLWIYLGTGQLDEVLVRPIMPVYTALLLLLVFSDARRWFGLPAATLAAVGLFALNEFASLTIVLWAEIPVAFFSYLSARAIVEAANRRGSFMTGGAFAGMAALVKFNGFVLLLAVALAPLVLVLWERRGDLRASPSSTLASALRRFGLFLVAGLLVASPLIIRNIAVFGNPIYPFLFGGTNTEQIGYYAADYSATDYLRFRLHEAVILAGSPLTLGIAFGLLRARAWSSTERLLLLSYLLYLPVYLFPPLGGSHVRYLAPILPIASVFAGPQLAWWLVHATVRSRLLGSAAAFGLVCVVAIVMMVVDVRPSYLEQYAWLFGASSALVVGLAALPTVLHSAAAKRMGTIALAVGLLVPGMLAVAAERYPPREAALDFQFVPPDRTTFLEARLGDDWRMWDWINRNLPADAVLLTFEARLFYLDRTVVFGADHELLPTYAMTLAEAVAFVRSLGVQYVLDSPWSRIPEINRIFITRSVIFQNLGNTSYFQVVHTEGQVTLYDFT